MTAPTELDEHARTVLEAAYAAGFQASGEGYNAEYPFADDNGDFESDTSWVALRDERLKPLLRALPASQAGWREPDGDQIDRAGRHLRETLQSGKRLTAWEDTPKATKKKWLTLAESTLLAAAPDRRAGE